ncbi:hypothetical protein [Parvularcula sp. LCG005]|uniref:hypothetical protein n=1 Tax=Parvularcula sp. LCG005 TaxID=3078805 RepID=UPI0029423E57|nr:hypothetical protein [Parvularcula sp. LCG005]WOI54281.1 hypothetical protein RUI03_04595 [Parvularcula sp. LCG005]
MIKWYTDPAFVYVATHDGLTKIGYSFDAGHRMRVPLKMRGMSRGAPELFWSLKLKPHRLAWLTEQRALGVLCAHVVDGEWLRVSPKLARDTVIANVETALLELKADAFLTQFNRGHVNPDMLMLLDLAEHLDEGSYPTAWWNALEDGRRLRRERRATKKGPAK